MSEACVTCLRRGYLVGQLAPYLAGILDRRGNDDTRIKVRGVLSLSDADLIAAVAGDSRRQAHAFLEGFDPAWARDQLDRRGLFAVCKHSEAYPRALGALLDAPAVLFITAPADRLRALCSERPVAVVGARRGSPYGWDMAYEIGRGLGAAGVTVVSGLALGVDACAHRGCLDAGGPAIGVLAGGPDVPYPQRNRALYERLRQNGIVLSELPPGIRPFRWGFPARNRIMAGLTAMTVVVEASARSGSMITSEFAAQMGRTVAAVPGRANAKAAAGSNELIKDGARLISSAEDVLDELFGVGNRPAIPAVKPWAGLDEVDAAVLDAVAAELDMDGICAAAGLPIRETRAALSRLEGAGRLKRDGLGTYRPAAAVRAGN